MTFTDVAVEQILTPELEPGERLLWSGRPKQGLVLRPSDAFLVPFICIWAGIPLFGLVKLLEGGSGANRPHGTTPPPLLAILPFAFVLAGLYFAIGRFWVDARMRRATCYGLTDRRIIIRTGMGARVVKSVLLRSLGDITLSERHDGSGTITLGASGLPRGYGAFVNPSWPGTGGYAMPMLDLIPEARRVYGMIRDAQAGGA